MNDDRHLCWAPDCHVELPMHLFACPIHWRMLPAPLKRALTAGWSGAPGDYLAAHEEAVAWLGEHA